MKPCLNEATTKFELPKKVLEEDKGEILPEELNQLNQQPNNLNIYRVPELDEEGFSIISTSYLTTKSKMVPWDR